MNFLETYILLEQVTSEEEKNTEYIEAHRADVLKFADWLKENIPEIFDNVDIKEFDKLIKEHDASKFSKEEFKPYARKWFGDGKKTKAYNKAWEHHWKTNKHHPEFWQGKDMDYIYILEMLCDWGSFGIKNNNIRDLCDFYYNEAKDDEEKMLSDNTKKEIESILTKIENVLDNQKTK